MVSQRVQADAVVADPTFRCHRATRSLIPSLYIYVYLSSLMLLQLHTWTYFAMLDQVLDDVLQLASQRCV